MADQAVGQQLVEDRARLLGSGGRLGELARDLGDHRRPRQPGRRESEHDDATTTEFDEPIGAAVEQYDPIIEIP